MRKHFRMIFTVTFLSVLLAAVQAGCGTDHTVYFEQRNADTQLDTAETAGGTAADGCGIALAGTAADGCGIALAGTAAAGQETIAAEKASRAAGESTQKPGAAGESTQKTGVAGESTQNTGAEETPAGESDGLCYVHVCGAVQTPGVYVLAPGSRVCEAVAMAGGLSEDASDRSVNQAEPVRDGQMIFVPTKEEAASGMFSQGADAATGSAGVPGTGGASDPQGGDGPSGGEDHRVNLNTATAEELTTLSGIGQSKAEDIIAYREENGGFSSPEEIMQIRGIKEGLYNRIKDDIKVK